MTSTERDEIVAILTKHRGLFLVTLRGLTDEQARQTPTVSALNLGGLVKHVTETVVQWLDFVEHGPQGAKSKYPALGRFNLLNTADGCRDLTAVNVPSNLSATAGPIQCSRDARQSYAQVLPEQERFGGAVRFTANVGAARPVLTTRYTHVYQRQPDGGFKIVHEHMSAPPPGTGTP